MAVNKIKEICVCTEEGNKRETLRRLAATAMSSKLIHRNADFFTKSTLRLGTVHVKPTTLTATT